MDLELCCPLPLQTSFAKVTEPQVGTMRLPSLLPSIVLLCSHRVNSQTDPPSDSPSMSPVPLTGSPSSLPTPVVTEEPTFSPRECYSNLTVLTEIEERQDPFTFREYILCPNTVFKLGFTRDFVCCVDGMTPIIPRSNSHYKCGEDGSIENNCTLVGGESGVLSTPAVFDEVVSDVTIQGIHFERQTVGVLLASPGDITFIDCEFSVSWNRSRVIVRNPPSSSLTVIRH